MKNVRIIGGSSNPKLVSDVSYILNRKPIGNVFEYFANSEFRVVISESLRGKDVFILQTAGYYDKDEKSSKTANDYLMEIYILAKTLRRSDVKTLNLIVPFFPYSRGDKKDGKNGAISARDIADLFELSGIDKIITFDLHSLQIQGFFQIPCENLSAKTLIIDYLNENLFKNNDNYKNEYILVSPDEGALKKTKEFADFFELPMIILSKQRDYSMVNYVEKMVLIGDREKIKNRKVIVVDDMIDTFGTMDKVSSLLSKNGALGLIVCATHGIFSNEAIDLINKNNLIDMVLVSDSIPQHVNKQLSKKIKVFSIANMIASSIKEYQKSYK